MAPVLSQYSRTCIALLSSQGSCRYITALGQHHLRHTGQNSAGRVDLNRRWKSWFWRKKKDSGPTKHGHTYPSPSEQARLQALIARELRRRGDVRDPDDLGDFEFNELYLQVESGALDSIDYMAREKSTPRPFTKQEIIQLNPQFLQPKSYDPQSSSWAAFGNGVETLRRGHMLKIASWNLFFSFPGSGTRASAALAYLRTMFGQEPHNLVVMFQEVRQQSLEAILNDKWVQQNFVLSDTRPPDCLYRDDEFLSPEEADREETDRQPSLYFTVMMVSRNLPISNCFRVPFLSTMQRDVLVVDIPVSEAQGPKESTQSLRLCTTHLESLFTGKEYRTLQLAAISALLKGELSQGKGICGGLLGGDMNSSDPSEHDSHRAPKVGLKDVWEDEPAPTPPVLKPFKKDLTYGRARGNTWGYQSDNCRSRRRLDKFLYTGFIETVAVDEAQDVTGRLGRFGIGLKTSFGADDVWVSDHFGITVGIRVV